MNQQIVLFYSCCRWHELDMSRTISCTRLMLNLDTARFQIEAALPEPQASKFWFFANFSG
jgi:hypothetical protein